jgi:hypothetical protein
VVVLLNIIVVIAIVVVVEEMKCWTDDVVRMCLRVRDWWCSEQPAGRDPAPTNSFNLHP